MNREQLQEWQEYEDSRCSDENTEEYSDGDMIEVDDSNALSAAKEENPFVDKIVVLPEYDFNYNLEDYDWDSFHREVIYAIEQDKEAKV